MPDGQQTLAQLIRTKYPTEYKDMDDPTLERAWLAKYPEYSDLPRTEQPLAPNPNEQIRENFQRVGSISPDALTPSGMVEQDYPGPKRGRTESPYTDLGQRIANVEGPYSESQRQSGILAGTTAAGMATGGVFPTVAGGGFLRNVLPFLGRAGASGAGAAAGTLAGGGTPQEAKHAAIGGVVGQPIAEGASATLPFLAKGLKNTATKQYERALAPTTKINKSIAQDITPELIQRGEYGSLEGLEKSASQNISELNPQLNSKYGQAQGAGPIKDSGDQVVSDLENLKQSYMPEGNVAQPQAVQAIENVQGIVKQYGSDISPNSLRRLRQIFEEAPAQRGAYAGTDLSTNYTLNAQQAAADSIRGILNKNPDIGSLNKEISFWLDVQRVTSQSALRRTGQEGGLMKVLAPLGMSGAAATAGLHYGAEAGVEAGAITAMSVAAARIVRSPAWRTMSAVTKDRLAQALASGNAGVVSELAIRVGAANLQNSQTPEESAPKLPWLPERKSSLIGQPLKGS